MPSSNKPTIKGSLLRPQRSGTEPAPTELPSGRDSDFAAYLQKDEAQGTDHAGAEHIDLARDDGARRIRRAAYAAARGVAKSRVDIGVVAYASAVIKALQQRLEHLQDAEAHTGRPYHLTITGNGRHTGLSMYLAAGEGRSGVTTLVVPGLVDASGQALRPLSNSPERERVALCRPLNEIIREALAPEQTWDPQLSPHLKEISVHPGTGEQLIEQALRSLTYARHAQRVLQRESLRPLFYLQEAEDAAPHTSRSVLALRAEERLDQQFPHLSTRPLPQLGNAILLPTGTEQNTGP